MKTEEISWFERNPKLTLTIFFIFLLFAFEISVRIAASFGLIPIVNFPERDDTKRFLGDINEHFGVWHYPNRESLHVGACFSAKYVSNSYGARDKERSLQSPDSRRVVVLGDSFAEGAGVDVEHRVSNLLEAVMGFEFLNFGTSGDFGTIQETLLYENLASNFSHSEILAFLLPANDFRDNDQEHFSEKRYRPYLDDSSKTFSVKYPIEFGERSEPKGFKTSTKIRRYFYNRIYLLNLLRNSSGLIQQVKASLKGRMAGLDRKKTNYLDYSELDIERVLKSYERLVSLAKGRSITIVVIPRLGDLQIFAQNPELAKSPSLIEALELFAQKYPNVKIVDLLPAYKNIESALSEHFIPCDGHWTPMGSAFVADYLRAQIYS